MIRAALPLDHAEAIAGAVTFVGDVDLPGQLHAAFVRSWLPHAHLLGIGAAAARVVPGVVAVLHAPDLPVAAGRIAIRLREPDTRDFLQPVLARDRVRYVGEPVAVVLAESRRAAEDGAERVDVELAELPVVVSAAAGVVPGAALLFPDTNVAATVTVDVGDVESSLAASHLVLEREFAIGRQTGMPLECRGTVARWDGERRRLELWGPTKLPHYTRRVTAEALGLALTQVRVREVRAGGGFGVRGEVYPEDIAVAFAALHTGRPVKWIEDRREHMLATNHSREQSWHVRMGFDEAGRITAVDAQLLSDMGAYLRTHGTVVPRLAAAEFCGPYVIPAYRCQLAAVMTNKTPSGTCRSPGRYEATFVRERLLDLAARALRLDPFELRRRNLVPPERMPYDTGVHLGGLDVVYDSGNYLETLQLAHRKGRERHLSLAQAAGSRRLGFGLAAYNEATGHGPQETAAATLLPSGDLAVETGAPSLGQGHETVFAQVAAAATGWPLDRVRVRPLDTDSLGSGGGTWASRGATVAAGAVDLAARALRTALAGLAAEQLGCTPDQVELGPDGATARGSARRLTPDQLLRTAAAPDGIGVVRAYRPRGQAFPYGATAATVAVDVETGGVDVLSLVVTADVGRALNAEIVRGQLQGAAVQGVGGALLEELVYSEAGQPLSTTFVDYLLPSAADVPAVEVHVLENHPSPITPLGAKGAGELGILGSAPAIANAICDALRPLEAELNRLPVRPEDVARAAAPEAP